MKKLIILLTLILSVITSKAQNFSALNNDGDTIYYKILTDSTIGVTYKGSSHLTYNEYTDTITIPSEVLYNNILYKVTSIENKAFSNNDSLKHIILPKSIKYIMFGAFVATNIKNIIIPSNVDSLGGSLFSGTQLNSITFLSKYPPSLSVGSLYYLPNDIDFHVLCGSLNIYQNTTYLTRFTNIIEDQLIINEIDQSICDGSVYNQNGFNDSIAGTYYRSSQTSYGCDSLTILNLIVKPTYNIVIYDTICDNHIYIQNGFYVNTMGTHTLNLQTIDGCDSIITLHLATKPTYNTILYDTICSGTFYDTDIFHLGNVDTSGIHSVILQSRWGCDSTVTLNLCVHKPVNTKLCMISVDTNNHNELIWNRTKLVDYYKIYRETTITNEYIVVANVNYNNICRWIDTNSNPNTRAYRYKISSIDTCGNESILSDYHKTIHLTIGQGANDNTWNLNWTPYEGTDYQTYYIYRKINNGQLTLIDSIASNYNSWTDIDAQIGNIYYQIEILATNCDPTKSQYNSIKSNIVDNGVVSLPHINSDIKVKIYPNPAKNKTLIQLDNINGESNIILYDIFGRYIKEINSNKTQIELDLSNIPEGNYIIKISNNGKQTIKKLIVK
ncbi:MAG: leucine-rich repeat protein [Candidatus Muirbacterium halophilum]|nr:leucine-rich repeat protein [Candidatus Muirbacterium halophilum]